MKRICAALLSVVFCVLLCLPLCAEETTQAPTSYRDIPVTVQEDFPAAVDNIVTKNAFIANSERIDVADIQMVIDSCADALGAEENTLVRVDTQVVLKVEVLKQRGTVECGADYVYTTSSRGGVKYEWMYFADGRIEKTVSYDYEERTADFELYTYKARNINNESIEKYRIKAETEEFQIDIPDMLFGMAIAVVLMMIAVVIVRAIKKT